MAHLGLVSLVVREYDEAIRFFVGTLGFELREDTYLEAEQKRWVVVAPPGATETAVLLARAKNDEERAHAGNQTGGRIGFFLYVEDFEREYARLRAAGVTFVREPKRERYGKVAVFLDLYGNQWDLLEPAGQ